MVFSFFDTGVRAEDEQRWNDEPEPVGLACL